MPFESLREYRRWIWNCQSCSTCQKGPQNVFSPAGPTPDRICPSYDLYRRLTYSAQGRILAARATLALNPGEWFLLFLFIFWTSSLREFIPEDFTYETPSTVQEMGSTSQ